MHVQIQQWPNNMFSLITKISHSLPLKDTIAVLRGVYKVASAGSNPSLTKDWIQKPSQTNSQQLHKPNPIKQQSLSPKTLDKYILKPAIEKPEEKQVLQQVNQSTKEKIVEKARPQQIANVQKEKDNAQQKAQMKDWNGVLQGGQRKQSKVISSRFGRIFEYGKLGKWMLETQVQAYVARSTGYGNQQQIYEKGANRITEELCKMRGAPLKVAQMLSIQQDNLIPAPVRKAFEKAREQAHVMPEKQVQSTLKEYLGADWAAKFKAFEMKPFAAASIGQVHKAVSLEGKELAVKLQYPGVEKSIESDMKNIKMLLKFPGILPKGIFLDKLLANTQKELKQQCDYQRQAKMHELYDNCLKAVMGNQYSRFVVPKVSKQLSQKHLLVSQLVKGVPMSNFELQKVSQAVRDEVGRLLMKLTFSEIFQMGIMQSDPNPSNFTYNTSSTQLNLFDFGATHIYDKGFLRHYSAIINASVQQNREDIIKHSVLAGFLTNEQNTVMLDNHVESILMLGQPLRWKGVYDFGNQKITEKIYKTIPQMLKNRLKSPPQQVYSLHRKLSGAYLACIRMRSRVDCQTIFTQLRPNYQVQQFL